MKSYKGRDRLEQLLLPDGYTGRLHGKMGLALLRAIAAVAEPGDERVTLYSLAALERGDSEVAEWLIRFPDERALPGLLNRLVATEDLPSDSRRSLGEFHDLLEALKACGVRARDIADRLRAETSQRDRTNLASALLAIATAAEEKELFMQLSLDSAKEIRWFVVRRLAGTLPSTEPWKEPEYAVLLRLIQDQEWSVRFRAIDGLRGHETDPAADAAVIHALAMTVAEQTALGSAGGSSVVASAVRYAASLESPARVNALVAAIRGVYATPAAISLLLLGDAPAILRVVFEVLKPLSSRNQLAKHDDLLKIDKLRSSSHPAVARGATECLRSGDLLFELLVDKDRRLRSDAGRTLQSMSSVADVERLHEFTRRSGLGWLQRIKLWRFARGLATHARPAQS